MPLKGFRCRAGCSPLAVGRVPEPHRRRPSYAGAGDHRAHRSTIVLCRVLPRPGASTATGVSSACTFSPAITYRCSACTTGQQQLAARGHPVGQRRARQLHAMAGIDGALAIQRLMIAVLGDHHLGQQPGASQAAGDGPRRRRHLHDRLAPSASQLGAHHAYNFEAGRHVFQSLADVLAQPLKLAAASRAVAAGGWMQDVGLARQRFGQGLRRDDVRGDRDLDGFSSASACCVPTGIEVSLIQRQLIEQIAAFAAASEAILPRFGKLPAQMLDFLLQ